MWQINGFQQGAYMILHMISYMIIMMIFKLYVNNVISFCLWFFLLTSGLPEQWTTTRALCPARSLVLEILSILKASACTNTDKDWERQCWVSALNTSSTSPCVRQVPTCQWRGQCTAVRLAQGGVPVSLVYFSTFEPIDLTPDSFMQRAGVPLLFDEVEILMWS